MVYEQGSYTQRYVYDDTGRRISAEFTYAENTLPGEPGENFASEIAVNSVTKIWYRVSHLDSTLYAVDATGAVVSHAVYDPWGNPLAEKPTQNYAGIDNLNNFTGYTWDETLGLYFAQNRFYSAQTHRFTQEDPVKDGGNWYVYCGNGPMVFIDPMGTIFVLLRPYAYSFGAIVTWNEQAKSATVELFGKKRIYTSNRDDSDMAYLESGNMYVDDAIFRTDFGIADPNNPSFVAPPNVAPATFGSLEYGSLVYKIYIPKIENGSNLIAGFAGNKKNLEEELMFYSIANAVLSDQPGAGDLVNTDNVPSGAAAAMLLSDLLKKASDGMVHFNFYADFYYDRMSGDAHCIIMLGLVDDGISSRAGSYYYVLQCSTTDHFTTVRQQEDLGQAVSGERIRHDIKVSVDAARKDDKYMFYLYIDSAGTWCAKIRKFAGDNYELVNMETGLSAQLGIFDKSFRVDTKMAQVIDMYLMNEGVSKVL